jgi:hypothetical protein
MSAIPPNLPPLPPAVTLDRGAKSSGHGHGAHRAASSPAPLTGANDSSAPASDDSSLQAALTRIQNQNLASALTSIKDLDEAQAATIAARQGILSQPGAAQSAQSGVNPQNALSLLQD